MKVKLNLKFAQLNCFDFGKIQTFFQKFLFADMLFG